MKVYKQNEWLTQEKENGSVCYLTSVTINKGTIVKMGFCEYRGGLETWGHIFPKGNVTYRLEADKTVSRIVDCDEKIINKVRPSKDIVIKNKMIIPFWKWYKDFVPVFNHRHERKEDHIKGLIIDGIEAFLDGTIYRLTSTHKHELFDCDDWCIDPTDIITFQYGITRDVCDDWRKHAYFTEDYDLVFDADGEYHYNCGYNEDYFGKGKCGLEEIGFGIE